MHLDVKDGIKSIGGRIIISAVTVLVGIAVTLLSQVGITLLPILSALLVLLFVAERSVKPILSFAVPSVLIILDLVWSGLYSISSATAVLVAVLVYFSLSKAIMSKGECALALTTIVSLSIGAMLIFAAFYEIGKVDFAGALEYYQGIISENRAAFIEEFDKYLPEGIDPELAKLFDAEMLGAMYDSYMNIMISFVVIVAFLLVGLMFKLLGLLLAKALVAPRDLKLWHFELSPIFAYFYLLLYVLGLFFSGTDIFSVSILNLTNIFMFIFAYVGFIFALVYLRRRLRSKLGAVLLLLVAVLMLYSLAISLLSFLGVFATIMLGRLKSMSDNHDDVNNK